MSDHRTTRQRSANKRKARKFKHCKDHPTIQKNCKISEYSLRKMIHKSGGWFVKPNVFDMIRDIIEAYVEAIVSKAVIITDHYDKKTITTEYVIEAGKRLQE